MPPATRAPKAKPRSWDEPVLAPIVLVRGPEGLLRERAVEGILAVAREGDPATERESLDGATYGAGQLLVAASPSLFDEAKLVVITGAESATDDLIADLVAYTAEPIADVGVVVVHAGGNRGKRALDAIVASGAPVIQCDEVKSDAQKAAFVANEVREARRRAEPEAIRALVDALGSDLRELAAATSQLIADTSGTITAAAVDRYYGGRVEATGFKVADAAVAGNSGEAVALLRHALATGVDPVPIVSALAMRLRNLARAAAIRGGTVTARELGLQEWQLRQLNSDLRRWNPEGLASAIEAVARANEEVVGAGRDRVFAVERAALEVARHAGA